MTSQTFDGLCLFPQNTPRDVRAQVFADDDITACARLAFDNGAALSGDLSVAPEPFADGWLLDAEDRGHSGLTSKALDRTFDCIHGDEYRHYRYTTQAHCLLLALPVEIPRMHTGKKLGEALKAAMALKKEAGLEGATQDEVAIAFGVKQPSVAGWRSNGRIHKKHLNLLVEFFADVVGPEHWGMPASWRAQSLNPDELLPLREGEPDLIHAFRLLTPDNQQEIYAEVMQLVLATHGPTMRTMQRLRIDTHADDAAVENAYGGKVKRTRQAAPRTRKEQKVKPAKTPSPKKAKA